MTPVFSCPQLARRFISPGAVHQSYVPVSALACRPRKTAHSVEGEITGNRKGRKKAVSYKNINRSERSKNRRLKSVSSHLPAERTNIPPPGGRVTVPTKKNKHHNNSSIMRILCGKNLEENIITTSTTINTTTTCTTVLHNSRNSITVVQQYNNSTNIITTSTTTTCTIILYCTTVVTVLQMYNSTHSGIKIVLSYLKRESCILP